MDSKRLKRDDWTRFLYPLSNSSDKKVKAVSFNLIAKHQSGNVRITDLQLQMGEKTTGQTPNTSELLMPLTYGVNERANIDTISGAKKKGVQAKPSEFYTNLDQRMFNIVGRGHEVIVLPNVFHEDYTQELLTSGLELELYAKEDFDLLRISTNDGALVPGRRYSEDSPFPKHPLNYKYTREFYFEGAKADEKITLSGELGKASLNNKPVSVGQLQSIRHGVNNISFSRQRLMVAPYGSFRLRIEFYKLVTEVVRDEYGQETTETYLKDVGIGFYGVARFSHVTGNHKF